MSDTHSVRKSISVAAPREVAFRVFTEQWDRWWPLATHHIGQTPAAAAVLEPRVGGRWYERGTDGVECLWGRVLAWEPPARLVLTWEISADFQPDPSLRTEVEVRFVAESPERTRVELEHRLLDRYGARAGDMRSTFDSENGWSAMLAAFAARAEQAAG